MFNAIRSFVYGPPDAPEEVLLTRIPVPHDMMRYFTEGGYQSGSQSDAITIRDFINKVKEHQKRTKDQRPSASSETYKTFNDLLPLVLPNDLSDLSKFNAKLLSTSFIAKKEFFKTISDTRSVSSRASRSSQKTTNSLMSKSSIKTSSLSGRSESKTYPDESIGASRIRRFGQDVFSPARAKTMDSLRNILESAYESQENREEQQQKINLIRNIIRALIREQVAEPKKSTHRVIKAELNLSSYKKEAADRSNCIEEYADDLVNKEVPDANPDISDNKLIMFLAHFSNALEKRLDYLFSYNYIELRTSGITKDMIRSTEEDLTLAREFKTKFSDKLSEIENKVLEPYALRCLEFLRAMPADKDTSLEDFQQRLLLIALIVTSISNEQSIKKVIENIPEKYPNLVALLSVVQKGVIEELKEPTSSFKISRNIEERALLMNSVGNLINQLPHYILTSLPSKIPTKEVTSLSLSVAEKLRHESEIMLKNEKTLQEAKSKLARSVIAVGTPIKEGSSDDEKDSPAKKTLPPVFPKLSQAGLMVNAQTGSVIGSFTRENLAAVASKQESGTSVMAAPEGEAANKKAFS